MGFLDNILESARRSIDSAVSGAGLDRAARNPVDDPLVRRLSLFETRREQERQREEERKRQEQQAEQRRQAQERMRRYEEEQRQRREERTQRLQRQEAQLREQTIRPQENAETPKQRQLRFTEPGLSAERDKFIDDFGGASDSRKREMASELFDVNETFKRTHQDAGHATRDFGRGVISGDQWRSSLESNAAAALSINPGFSVLPDYMADAFGKNKDELRGASTGIKDYVAAFRFQDDPKALEAYGRLRQLDDPQTFSAALERDPELRDAFNYLVGRENDRAKTYERNQYGAITGLVKKVTEDLPGPDLIGQIASSFETLIDSIGSETTGLAGIATGSDTLKNLSRKWASNSGITGDMPTDEAIARTLITAADVASFGPTAGTGSILSRFGKELLINAVLDVPAAVATIEAYDIDPTSKEGMSLLGLTVGADVLSAGAVSGGGVALRGARSGALRTLRTLEQVPGGREAVTAATGAGFGAAGAEVTGNDPRAGALLGAAAPFAYSAGERIGLRVPARGIAEGGADAAFERLRDDLIAVTGAAAGGYIVNKDDREAGALGMFALTAGRRWGPLLGRELLGLEPRQALPTLLGAVSDSDRRKLADILGEPEVRRTTDFTPPGARAAEPVIDATKKIDNGSIRRLKAAEERARPTADHLVEAKRVSDKFLRGADAAVDDPRAMARLTAYVPGLRKVVEAIDSGIKYQSEFARSVHSSAVAAADFLRYGAGTQHLRARNMWNTISPIVGSDHHIRNALIQLTAGLVPVAGGVAATKVTGEKRYTELGAIAGLTSLGAASAIQRRTKFSRKPWESIALRVPSLHDDLPTQLRSGPGKLYDILQHPERYDLTREQEGAIARWYQMDGELVRETNAYLLASDMDLIPSRMNHGILQWFTPESVQKVLGDKARTYQTLTPGFSRKRPPELFREMGESYEEALVKHPELELVHNPYDLLQMQLKMHDQIRSLAIMTKGIKESGGAVKAPDLSSASAAERRDWQRTLSFLKEDGFQKIAGIEDYWFHPDVAKAVEQLLVPTRGREEGLLAALDRTTNFMRQAMFTSDLSAWTMQGLMAAIEDPLGVIGNAHHLVGATFGGRKYFDWWVNHNKALWEDFTASGAATGREFGEFEVQGPFTLGRAPGVRHVEEAGFERFLPIHRALLWKHNREMNAFAERLFGRRVGRTDIGRLASEFTANGPLVAGVAAAATDQFDFPGTDSEAMDMLMGVALGFSASMFARAGMRHFGAGVLRNPERAARIGAEAAKQSDRISGTMNRQRLGISAEQSQLERTLFFRSPALTRNTLILAKHALTDFGPEGAMARGYLLKTALLMGAGLAAYKYAVTGEWDSFDPTDPTSVFSPENMLRDDLGGLGKISPSNPNVSMLRALIRTDRPDNVKRWRFDDWTPLVGLKDWYASRAPDVFGSLLVRPQFSSFEDDTELLSPQALGRLIPLSAQSLFESGVIQQNTELGKAFAPQLEALGLNPDPNVSNRSEQLQTILGQAAGVNTSPETLAQEYRRIRQEVTNRLFPDLADRNEDGIVGYEDLNAEQKDKVKEALNSGQGDRYREIQQQFNEQEKSSDEQPSPVSEAIDARTNEQNRYLKDVHHLDILVRAGMMSRQDFIESYKAAREEHFTRLEQIQGDLFTRPAGRPGTDETVEEYLSRNQTPEDAAVEGYYDIYKNVVDKFGKINFDRLERKREEYLNGLDAETRAYVLRRVEKFGGTSSIKTLREYEEAKAKLKPFWEKRDELFQKYKAMSPTMSQFQGRGDFEEALSLHAAEIGISPQDMLEAVAQTDPGVRLYQRLTEVEQRVARLTDPETDQLLVDWYGYVPQNPQNVVNQIKRDISLKVGGLPDISEESATRRLALKKAIGLPESLRSYFFGNNA